MVPQGTSTHIISFHPHSNLERRQSSNPVSQSVDGNPGFRAVKGLAQGHTARRWQSWDLNQAMGDLVRFWGAFLSPSLAEPRVPGERPWTQAGGPCPSSLPLQSLLSFKPQFRVSLFQKRLPDCSPGFALSSELLQQLLSVPLI